MDNFDVIVAGAGVAGSSTAALLGQSGFRVLLLEKAQFPRRKVCGEGLMPAGAELLDKMGLGSSFSLDRFRPFSAIRLYLPCGQLLELNFREIKAGARGLITPRNLLDSQMAEFASNQQGVDLCEGFQLQSTHIDGDGVRITAKRGGWHHTFKSRVLVGADGIRSRLHGRLGVQRLRRGPLRFALRALCEGHSQSEEAVEVHCCPGGEAYVAPLGKGQARITLLLYGPATSSSPSGLSDLYLHQLRRFPALVKRLSASRPQEVESTSPVGLRLNRCHGQRLLLVGDAGGALDPVTGQGMTVALKDAALASRILKEHLLTDELGESQLAEYTKRRESYFLPSHQLAYFLLKALRYPFLARRGLLMLSRNQKLRHRLICLASGLGETTWLSSWERLRLLVGI